uniref:Putative ovule protein n=1 Tax=Solanum chacoense TaxID=4108 RepID=A0A0V0GHS4_SOLCH
MISVALLFASDELFNGYSTCSLLFSLCLHLSQSLLKISLSLPPPAQVLLRDLGDISMATPALL